MQAAEEEGGARSLSPTVKRRPSNQAETLKSGPPTTWWVSAETPAAARATAAAKATINTFNTVAILSS